MIDSNPVYAFETEELGNRIQNFWFSSHEKDLEITSDKSLNLFASHFSFWKMHRTIQIPPMGFWRLSPMLYCSTGVVLLAGRTWWCCCMPFFVLEHEHVLTLGGLGVGLRFLEERIVCMLLVIAPVSVLAYHSKLHSEQSQKHWLPSLRSQPTRL